MSLQNASTAIAPDGATHRPLIILGADRSGTTLLYSLLANHPDVYWFSRLDTVLLAQPTAACAIRRLAAALPVPRRPYVAIPGHISRTRGVLSPSECVPYWQRLFGFGDEHDYRVADDVLDASDLHADIAARTRHDLAERAASLGKSRLLLKQPGFSLRIGFLDALFPDAVFLHCVRHPWSHLRSLVDAKGRSAEKFWGIKIPGWQDMRDHAPLEQAVAQLEVTEAHVRSALAARRIDDTRYRRVIHEHLLADAARHAMTLMEWCGLRPDPRVLHAAAELRPAAPPQPLDATGDLATRIDRLVARYDEMLRDDVV